MVHEALKDHARLKKTIVGIVGKPLLPTWLPVYLAQSAATLSWCEAARTCTCVGVCVCIYIYICRCIYIHICIFMYIQMRKYTVSVHVYIYIYTYIFIHMYVFTYRTAHSPGSPSFQLAERDAVMLVAHSAGSSSTGAALFRKFCLETWLPWCNMKWPENNYQHDLEV